MSESENENETWVKLTDEQIDLLPVDGSVLVQQKWRTWTVQGYLVGTYRDSLWIAPEIGGEVRKMRRVEVSRASIYVSRNDVPTDTVESRVKTVLDVYGTSFVPGAARLMTDLQAVGLEIVRKEES